MTKTEIALREFAMKYPEATEDFPWVTAPSRSREKRSSSKKLLRVLDGE